MVKNKYQLLALTSYEQIRLYKKRDLNYLRSLFLFDPKINILVYAWYESTPAVSILRSTFLTKP
ncbi:MAG: hypothetical protein ACI93S_001409 [Ancylomarina sp.]|jgi:hypothetical protein